jgi:tRNA A-37 threonylcarbamoyl transferase component Bud32
MSEHEAPSPAEPDTDPGGERFGFLQPPQGPGELGRLGHYRVLELIGGGGMGCVFRAEDLQLHRQVALKVMKPEVAQMPAARERFLREARAAAALDDENVVTIFEVAEERDVLFLAMPCLKGMTLEASLRQAGLPTLPQLLRFGRQVALGLAAAHEKGLIHRDIKPSNLWLMPAGDRIKILDFGLARPVDDDVHLTSTGIIVGTPRYMSPEQALAETVDARSDLFSLGVVLYRMASGAFPFRGTTTFALLSALASEQPRSIRELAPTLPPAAGELIMQLLAKDPAARPASAREVAGRLQAIEERLPARGSAMTSGDSLSGPATAIMLQAAAPPRRRWGRWAAAAALVVLLGVLSWFLGGTVARFVTNQGVVVIDTDDPDIEVAIKDRTGTLRDRGSKREYTVKAGEEQIVEVTVRDDRGAMTKVGMRSFTVSRGGKVVLRVDLQGKPPPPPVKGDDRKAAAWALSMGRMIVVRVGNQERTIEPPAKLPDGEFELMEVDLPDKQCADADLACLKQLSYLRKLHLSGIGITDAGMVHLEGLKGLRELALSGTRVGDAGMEHLAGLTQLQGLSFFGNSSEGVSDAGLRHLQGLTHLRRLWLTSSRVSDKGLLFLQEMTELELLCLAGSQVSDAGLGRLKPLTRLKLLYLDHTSTSADDLAVLTDVTPQLEVLHLHGPAASEKAVRNLKGLPRLADLWLIGPGVTDACVEQLKECIPQLGALSLGHATLGAKTESQVTDKGLAFLKELRHLQVVICDNLLVTDEGLHHLRAVPDLRSLSIKNTRISARGLKQFMKARPDVDITAWSEPNREAASTVLAVGGKVQVRIEGQAAETTLAAGSAIPEEDFQVVRINFAGVKEALGPALARVVQLNDPAFDHLESVDFSGTGLTDADLATLKSLPDLTELLLTGTKVSDADLVTLKELRKLRRLVLDSCPIRGLGLEHLKALAELRELHLGCPTFTDAFAHLLSELKTLQRLSLAGSSLTEEGVQFVRGLTNLKELDLTGLKLPAAFLADLQKTLPMCNIRTKAPPTP